MITCNRCGKENQDHYKFCLGCGNEIKAAAKPAAAPAAPPAAAPRSTAASAPLAAAAAVPHEAHKPDVALHGVGGNPMATAATMLPPDPFTAAPTAPPAAPAAAAATPSLPGMSPSAPRSKSSGGIPWGDSPKMPEPLRMPEPVAVKAQATTPVAHELDRTPPPVALPPEPVLRMPEAPKRGPVTAPPVDAGFNASPITNVTAAPPTTATPPAPPAPAPPPGFLTCPSCGKDVKVGFAFCGVCGARMGGAPQAAAAATAAEAGTQRTMYMAAPQATAAPRGRLVLIRPDGSEGGTHPLHDGENLIGRGQGSLFDTDAYLSPRHAELSLGAMGLLVRDLHSLNGVFVKITQEEPLAHADVFRIGQELMRFDVIAPPTPLDDGTEVGGTPNPGFWGRLSVIVGRDVDGSAFPIFGEALVLGRERGDILFPEDGYVSGTHARISLRDGHVYLADLGSSNGTFLRIRGERTVPTGTFVLMGQQLFRIEYR